jgi:tricorn protease
VVYESAGRLWLLDDLDGEPQLLDVQLGGPRTAREPYRITVGDSLGRCNPDTTGRSSIIGVRGTVHRLTHRDGPARTLHATPGVRARLAAPLGDDRAVWVDDALGEDAVCIAPLDARAPDAPGAGRFGSDLGRVLELVPAPDGKSVALTTHDGRLLLLADGEFRELARGGDGEIHDVAFSPDSAWLAYCDPVGSGLTQVILVRLADGEAVPVTEGRLRARRSEICQKRRFRRCGQCVVGTRASRHARLR